MAYEIEGNLTLSRVLFHAHTYEPVEVKIDGTPARIVFKSIWIEQSKDEKYKMYGNLCFLFQITERVGRPGNFGFYEAKMDLSQKKGSLKKKFRHYA